jgi:hypothetical protein
VPRPPDTSLRAEIEAVWRGDRGAARTRAILVASVCSGVLGYTLSDALGIDLLLAYVVTVLVVFAATTAALVYRAR